MDLKIACITIEHDATLLTQHRGLRQHLRHSLRRLLRELLPIATLHT
jgi:hypothetical protein